MIFLDNASTTKTSEECIAIMDRYLREQYYNPSAPYHPSVVVSEELNSCRQQIAKALKAENGKIIFTSSGTESDNLALFGSKKANNSRILVSGSEHPAVARCADELKNKGYDVVFIPVDETGRVKEEAFIELMTKDVSFVSVMHVNNETGAINDIKKLVKVAKSVNPAVIFHSDGVQAVGKIPVSIADLNVDLYSFSSHKIHAPRGVGGLYVKNGIHLRPILFGGGQEYNVRSSTENVAGIAAFAHAVVIATNEQADNYDKVSSVRNALVRKLQEKGNAYRVLSDENCSPYIVNFTMKYVRGEVMLHSLEKYEIYVGTGSACSSKKSERSMAKIANLPKEYEKGILRVSFDKNTTIDEIDYFINKLNSEYEMLEKYMRG